MKKKHTWVWPFIIWLLFITLMVLLFSSCVTKRACDRKFPPQESTTIIRDSVVIFRDTTIFVYMPPKIITQTDTIQITIREGLAESRRSVLHADYSWTWAQVVGGRLRHELHQKDTTIQQTIERAIREAKTTETIETTVVREVNYVTGWQHFQIWLGRILAIGIFVLLLLRKLTRFV